MFLSISRFFRYFPQAPTSCKLKKHKTKHKIGAFRKETEKNTNKNNQRKRKFVIIFLVYEKHRNNNKFLWKNQMKNFLLILKSSKRGKFIKNQFHKWKLVEKKEIRVCDSIAMLQTPFLILLLIPTKNEEKTQIPPSPYL